MAEPPNICYLDLSLLFILLVGRNFVSGICKLKTKNLIKNIKPTNLNIFVKNLDYFSPGPLPRVLPRRIWSF